MLKTLLLFYNITNKIEHITYNYKYDYCYSESLKDFYIDYFSEKTLIYYYEGVVKNENSNN